MDEVCRPTKCWRRNPVNRVSGPSSPSATKAHNCQCFGHQPGRKYYRSSQEGSCKNGSRQKKLTLSPLSKKSPASSKESRSPSDSSSTTPILLTLFSLAPCAQLLQNYYSESLLALLRVKAASLALGARHRDFFDMSREFASFLVSKAQSLGLYWLLVLCVICYISGAQAALTSGEIAALSRFTQISPRWP